MAKKKRALASPFVPVEEQPYKIPDNWCWTYGSMVLEAMETQKPIGDAFDYIDIDAIDNQKQMVNNPKRLSVSEAPSRASRKLHAGDTVFSLVRPYLKNIAYIDDSLAHCIASTGFFVCTPKEFLNSRYLYQLMVSSYMVDGLNQYMKGDNSPSIRKDDIERFPFPLPPLSEQQRIVDRIESLFAKLDEAKEKAQAVVDGFELRKSAILHKAFSGELTERWRKEHSTDQWFTSTLGQYTNSQYGYTESATQEPIGPKFLRITDIQDGTVDWDKVPYCNISEDDLEKYLIRSGDIVIARTGATTGKSYLIADDIKAVFASYLIRLTMKQTGLIATYLYYFMQSPSYWHQITEFSAGIAQPGVNAKKLKRVELPIPPVEEQREIVFILDKLFRKEQQAQSAAKAVLSQIDTMKKAILARAFRGGLGTNDPAEEWAGALVKAVL
ncbi:MAG: hypothetical protein HFH56_07310 [Lachnospiraceae bacterium]|jgi:type I restriction enzyme S subunit|nr:hypothetical protein [Lachnospiraceae bacterium]MCI9471003.1 hypothetical protein [Lachnospiraceae bacterium]